MTKISSEYEHYQKSLVMKKLASIAHGEHFTDQTSSATFAEIASQVKKMNLEADCRALDAGCGNGAFSLPLAQNFSFEVQGVDLSQTLIEEAVAKAAKANLTHKCHFFREDFTSLPLHMNSTFDLVMCIGSLYWGQELATTLSTWYRITRSNGYLLLFLNLSYKQLLPEAIDAIGATQFIPALSLERELAKTGWVISEWSDGTNQYLSWLERWSTAIKVMEDNIIEEMGKNAAMQLKQRFMTYSDLARYNYVRRIILRAEHV